MKADIRKIFYFSGTWSFALCGMVLVVAAGVHRFQLDIAAPVAYTSSPLVAVELAIMLMMCLLFLLHIGCALYLVWKRRWRTLGILAISTAVGLGCLLPHCRLMRRHCCT